MTEWYDSTGAWSAESFDRHHIHDPEMQDLLVDFCEFNRNENSEGIFRVYDFGCGRGEYIRAIAESFRDTGTVGHFIGIDGCPISLQDDFCIGLQFKNANLTQPGLQQFLGLEACDIGICLEVAEHIPPELCPVFLDNLTDMCADKLILSWAIPGQGGLGHVNEKDRESVVGLLQSRGFRDVTYSGSNLHPWHLTRMPWFHRTMVFERA